MSSAGHERSIALPEGDWGPRPQFAACEALCGAAAGISDDGFTLAVPWERSSAANLCFLDPFGEYGCPQTIDKIEADVKFDALEGEYIDFEEPTPDYRIEVVGKSSSDYVHFGAGLFYEGTDITKKCGNRHEGSHWRYAYGAYSSLDRLETGALKPQSRVTVVLEYGAGRGRLSVTAEDEKDEVLIAKDLPPGCIIFAAASMGEVTLLAGRSTLGAPKTKSARKA
jgi:hypothetical protein